MLLDSNLSEDGVLNRGTFDGYFSDCKWKAHLFAWFKWK